MNHSCPLGLNYSFTACSVFWKSIPQAESRKGLGQNYKRLEKVTKVKLVKVLVKRFDKPTIFGPFIFLVAVLLHHISDSSMLKSYWGSLIWIIAWMTKPFPTPFLTISPTICQTKIFIFTLFPHFIKFHPSPLLSKQNFVVNTMVFKAKQPSHCAFQIHTVCLCLHNVQPALENYLAKNV